MVKKELPKAQPQGELPMRAMVLEQQNHPLTLQDLPIPSPLPNQLLIKVHTCGVCRTDLHILDGELSEPNLPLVLGHQIVGTIEKTGPNIKNFSVGQRIGVPWLGGSCQHCSYCNAGNENLCDEATYTGYQINGGYAEYCVANEDYCFPIPSDYPDLQAAPLLCAGLIGYRSYRMTGDAKRIGFYGFGAAAHILIQLALYEGKEVYAFTREGDTAGQDDAKNCGAVWSGDSTQAPPELLDAAIIFAPIGPLIPKSLKHLRKGGVVVCAGIHMSEIPSFPYSDLWGERVIRSVANLTRKDGEEFLDLAPKVPIRTEVKAYQLEEANQALEDFRNGQLAGSAVLVI